jgi:hypothetical protein
MGRLARASLAAIGLLTVAADRHDSAPHSGYLRLGAGSVVWPDSVQVLGGTLGFSGCPPVSLVWLSHGLRPRRAPREERLKRGLFCSK